MADCNDRDILTGRDAEALLRLGSSVPGGFFIYRSEGDGEIIYKNGELLDIFGCENEMEFSRLTGDTFRGIVYPDDYDAVVSSIDEQIGAGSEGLDAVQYRIRRADGAIRWVDDYGRLANLPGVGSVYYVFIWDVTDRLAAEEEKRRIERELERERRMKEVKSSFIFDLSHDIKTPMNAVVGFADLALRHLDDAQLLTDYLTQVKKSSALLLGIVDDLLEMNDLDRSRVLIKAEPGDVRSQIGDVIDILRVPAKEKGVSLVSDVEIPDGDVMIDGLRFRRVLGNLLDNAVKFTPSGGSVTLTARAGKESASGFRRYTFTVSDTGVGMTEEFMKRIFGAFERESTSTKMRSTGTGLGLSIVRSIVNLMGGTVKAESEKGKGSTFTVELPLRSAERKAEAEVERCGPESECEGRVLIVEDVDINRMLVESVLADAGFEAVGVPDGCDAVEIVKNSPPGYFDFILMDIQMPVMNGFEATRAIRALGREDTLRVPVVALSANTSEDAVKASLDSGMNAHVSKPFDADRLINMIETMIKENRERK